MFHEVPTPGRVTGHLHGTYSSPAWQVQEPVQCVGEQAYPASLAPGRYPASNPVPMLSACSSHALWDRERSQPWSLLRKAGVFSKINNIL